MARRGEARYNMLEDQVEFLKDKVAMLDDKIKMMNEMISMLRLTMERGTHPHQHPPPHIQREPVHIGVVHVEPINIEPVVQESQETHTQQPQQKPTHNPRTRSIT